MMTLWACKGPNAGKLIAANIAHANQLAMTVAVMAAISVVLYLAMRQFKVFPIVGLVLLVVQPAWTISPIMGDCGDLMAGAATFFALICCLGFAAQCALACLMILGWTLGKLRPRRRESYHDTEDDI